MCRFFEIARSAYYAWVARLDQSDQDADLLALVQQAYQASRQTYGYRRIRLWLQREQGLYINHKTVLRLMRKLGIQSVVRKRKPYPKLKPMTRWHRYPNHLQRDFQAQGPNQKWATDVTYIPTQQGWVYCAVIQDLFDGFIVGHQVLRRNTIDLVTTPLRQALAKQKVTAELLLHSDQGHQYCSHAYFVLTQQYAITPSMSRPGNYLDNAIVENFFGHLKEEAIRRQPLRSLAEAQAVIDDYIWFYNYERIQLKTKLTPAEVRGQFH
jgi:putative transposase